MRCSSPVILILFQANFLQVTLKLIHKHGVLFWAPWTPLVAVHSFSRENSGLQVERAGTNTTEGGQMMLVFFIGSSLWCKVMSYWTVLFSFLFSNLSRPWTFWGVPFEVLVCIGMSSKNSFFFSLLTLLDNWVHHVMFLLGCPKLERIPWFDGVIVP